MIAAADQFVLELPCEHCNGSGRRRLSPAEAQTFAVVTDDWQDTRQVRALLPVRIMLSAVANRLTALEQLGLVESTPWLAVRPYQPGAGIAKLWRRRPPSRST